jgi:hypothetical protein
MEVAIHCPPRVKELHFVRLKNRVKSE